MSPSVHARLPFTALLTVAAVVAGGCAQDGADLSPTEPTADFARVAAPAPAEQVTVPVGTGQVRVWPYAGMDYSGTAWDPISLIFLGKNDPRAIRAALLSLDGDRSLLPFPLNQFDCRWQDAMGTPMVAWSGTWGVSAIQLACGDYAPVRFHLRLWRAGGVTLGSAHFELMIPGTAEHQVLSWELAEGLVVGDFSRSGLLGAAPAETGAINTAPFWRSIPLVIYQALPAQLQAIANPLGQPATADIGILNDGKAHVLTLAGVVAAVPGSFEQHFDAPYDIIAPKPFCSTGPMDFVHLVGQVSLRQTVKVSPSGDISLNYHALGHLNVTPVNPLTGAPAGPTAGATVSEFEEGHETAEAAWVLFNQQQLLQPTSASPGQSYRFALKFGPNGQTNAERTADCGK